MEQEVEFTPISKLFHEAKFSLIVPMPPTVNHYKQSATNRRTGKKFYYLTNQARAWFEACRLSWPRHVKGGSCDAWWYEVAFVFHYVKSQRKQDSDNRLKALQDMIAKNCGVDDSQCVGGSFRGLHVKGREADYCAVRIYFVDSFG